MLPIGWRFGLAAAGLTAMCGDCATAGNESRFTAQFNLTLANKQLIVRQLVSVDGRNYGKGAGQGRDAKHRKFHSQDSRVSDGPRGRAVGGCGPEVQPLGPSGRTKTPIGYRHGLRASELCDLQWHQVELATGRLCTSAGAKSGSPSVHPLQGDEIRALRRSTAGTGGHQRYVFASRAWRADQPEGIPTPLFGPHGALWGQDAIPHPSAHAQARAAGLPWRMPGHDTRALQAWLGHREHPAHGALYRVGTGSVQRLLEITIGGKLNRGRATPAGGKRGGRVRSHGGSHRVQL